MKYEKIYLKEGRSDVYLETFVADSVVGTSSSISVTISPLRSP